MDQNKYTRRIKFEKIIKLTRKMNDEQVDVLEYHFHNLLYEIHVTI